MYAHNKIAALLLALATLIQALPAGYLWLLYAANQREIAHKLCERKVAHCDGHCYLKKQISRDVDQSDKAQTQKSRLENVQFFEEQSGLLPERTYEARAMVSVPAARFSEVTLPVETGPPRA